MFLKRRRSWMAGGIEKRLNSLEKRLERLEKAIPKEMECPECHLLLTIHEEYDTKCGYLHSSHAQCYRCGKYFDVKKDPEFRYDERRKLEFK
jgi:transcription elongation factor Elf1